jgi:alpha-amylase
VPALVFKVVANNSDICKLLQDLVLMNGNSCKTLFFSFIFLCQMTHAQDLTRPGATKVSPEKKVQLDCNKRVFYEIFVRSFYDSNADGIGDLNGITQKLDYLSSLGIGGLWLTPVNPSPSYHKYDITDYRTIDRQYGTLEDFKKLVAEAHRRNILVLMDLVVNHTSHLHPWFQEAINQNPKYRNFYVWQSASDTSRANWFFPMDNSGKQLGNQKYYGFFWKGMPDLNFDNRETRDAVIEIGKWWLKETHIDGFRLDAAQHIYDASEIATNNNWWKEFTDSMKTVKPDVITIGEVWNTSAHIAPYLASLSGSFNFPLAADIYKAVKEEQNDSLVEKLIETKKLYAAYSPDFIDPILLSNHDGDRIMSLLQNNLSQARLAASIYLTLPGTPFVYYGEEIGMRGAKPDSLIREPFLWDEPGRDPHQTNWEKSFYNTVEKVKPLSLQVSDSNSIFVFYKDLIALRRNNPSLTSDIIEPVNTAPQLLAYYRGSESMKVLVIHNLSAKTIKYKLGSSQSTFAKVLFQSANKVVHKKSKISLPAYSTVILGKI